MLWLVQILGFTVAGRKMFCGVSLKSVAVAIGLSVKLNVTGGERVSIIGGGNIENKELLNEEL